MGGETQGGGQGSTVKGEGRSVLGIGIPDGDHGEYTVYQNLFTVGDLSPTGYELVPKYVLFTKNGAYYFQKTPYCAQFGWIRYKTGSEKCINRPLWEEDQL